MTGIDIKAVIILQLIFSYYYIHFIIRPLSEIEKVTGQINYGYRLFIIRFIVLVGLDIFDPTLGLFLDIATLFTLAFVTVPKIKKELNYVHIVDSKLAKYDEITDEELTGQGIKNRKVLEQHLFKKLSEIQVARTNYDYDTLKRLCSEKLYNLFISELEVLHQADLGYHFEDYKLLESQIYSLSHNEKNLILKIAMKASCISYRLDAEKNLVDGSKTDRTIIVHELEFTKKLNTDDIELNCPNCGAPTKRNNKGKCSYCNTIIDTESTDWILSKNKVIAEKVVKKEYE